MEWAAARRGGRYLAYVPDLLSDRPLRLHPEVLAQSERVEGSIRALTDVPGFDAAEALTRYVLRCESVESDARERMEVASQHVGVAALATRLSW